VSTEAHESAKVRMTMAGAKPITWMAVTGEWAPYWASPERAALTNATSRAGSAALVNAVLVLRSGQADVALGAEDIAVEVGDPLPAARRDVEIADCGLDMRGHAVPVELRI